MPFIGEQEILSTELSGEKTPGGIDITKVIFADGKIEFFSDLMFL